MLVTTGMLQSEKPFVTHTCSEVIFCHTWTEICYVYKLMLGSWNLMYFHVDKKNAIGRIDCCRVLSVHLHRCYATMYKLYQSFWGWWLSLSTLSISMQCKIRMKCCSSSCKINLDVWTHWCLTFQAHKSWPVVCTHMIYEDGWLFLFLFKLSEWFLACERFCACDDITQGLWWCRYLSGP